MRGKEEEKKSGKEFYNNYVCPHCFQQIDACECEEGVFPPLTLIHIDLGMQKVIRTLNRKGYMTGGCCESHYAGNHRMYIVFMPFVDMPPAPDGFKCKQKEQLISQMIKGRSEDAFNAMKHKALAELETWADALEDRTNG